MSVNFGVLKTRVGSRVQDTSSSFATIIGYFINDRYREILRRTNFNAINPDYALTATSASTVPSASTYTLPIDFGKEMYVHNSGTHKNISHIPFDILNQEYESELENTGNIIQYSIFTTKDTSAASAEASAARVKKIRFFRAPLTDTYFLIPYEMRPADLSADTDELAVGCETAVEYGATADAWAYKRQTAKSAYYEGLYEKAIQSLMWDQDNQPNQIHLMNVRPLNRSEGI